MQDNIPIKDNIVIPETELEIIVSRSGGAGGQHVNKTESRVTVRWNIKHTTALDETLKQRVLQNLASRLTDDGDLIVHNSETRSQQQNKENAIAILVKLVRKALYIPKKRMQTHKPKAAKEERLRAKAQRSKIKKMRSKIYDE
jgi:ribosome-associated protein